MPLVTIITTTYKHQNFIAHTIESVLAQTFTDWELLIGDDSPDNETWDIIQKYVEKYPDKIKAWHHKPNKGLVENMRFLIKQRDMQSQYTAFLEGDDLYASDNLSKKMEIFIKYPKVGVVSSGLLFCDEWNNPRRNPYIFSVEYYMRKGLTQYTLENLLWNLWPPFRSFGNIMLSNKFVDDIVHTDLGMYENNQSFIPFDFVSRTKILPKTQTYHLREKLFIYRQHSANSSAGIHFKKGLEQLIFVYDMYKDQFPKQVAYMSILVKSKIYALEGKNTDALTLLSKAVYLYPFSHIVYKISIVLDILGLKKIVWKILHRFSSQ